MSFDRRISTSTMAYLAFSLSHPLSSQLSFPVGYPFLSHSPQLLPYRGGRRGWPGRRFNPSCRRSRLPPRPVMGGTRAVSVAPTTPSGLACGLGWSVTSPVATPCPGAETLPLFTAAFEPLGSGIRRQLLFTEFDHVRRPWRVNSD